MLFTSHMSFSNVTNFTKLTQMLQFICRMLCTPKTSMNQKCNDRGDVVLSAARAGQELMDYMKRNKVNPLKNVLVPMAQVCFDAKPFDVAIT